MSDVSITVVGNVGRAPTMFTSTNGTRWTQVRVASTRRLRDPQSGEWRDGETTWFTARAYGDHAQNVLDSIGQGTPVVVTGRFAVEEFTLRKEETGPGGEKVEVERPAYNLVVEKAAIAVDISRGVAKYTRAVRTGFLPADAPRAQLTTGPADDGAGGADPWELRGASAAPEGDENGADEDAAADARETVGV